MMGYLMPVDEGDSTEERFKMERVREPKQLQAIRKELTGSVGFVPTMGALHHGHLELIRRSVRENDHTVVSIFVNPTQFLPGEDLARYPRKEEADRILCEKAGVDWLFMPEAESLYFADESLVQAPRIAGYVLEGSIRPGHFSGVLQVVLKLLHLTSPNRAYFGKKDAQQLVLIQAMVCQLFLDVEIVPCDTVRDSDGLALSSRNVYLSAEERREALRLPQALKKAGQMIMKGEQEASQLVDAMQGVLNGVEIDYLAVTDRQLHPRSMVQSGDTLILGAVRIGQTRLIDNLWI